MGDRCLTRPPGRAQDSEPDLHQLPIDMAEKARLKSGHRQSPWRSSAFVGSTQDSPDLVMRVKSMRHLTMTTIARIVHPDSIPVNLNQ